MSTCGGQEEEVAYLPCDDVQDDLGVDTPKGDGSFTHGDSYLEQGLTLKDVHMGDDQISATDIGEYGDEGSPFDPRNNTGESACQH
jgi:hypothetical protein